MKALRQSRLVVGLVLIVVSTLLFTFPLVTYFRSSLEENRLALDTDRAGIEKASPYLWQEVDAYNRDLAASASALSDPWTGTFGSDTPTYRALLNLDNGVMGSVTYPKIGLHLRVGHGIGPDTLDFMAGHVPGTSLLGGGPPTHSVISAHRGGVGNPLFTRLGEASVGDVFYIKTADRELAYKVYNIETVSPDQVDRIKIQADRDLVTLITCTPFGVNTHRLLITAARTYDAPPAPEGVRPGYGWVLVLIGGYVVIIICSAWALRRYLRGGLHA